MKLSEAIKIGSLIRPESHQERFCNVEGRGLCSDVWGAACEAVHPQVAKLNWNLNDKQALNSALRYLNEIQHKYFETYFQMPATCPLASRSLVRGAGRIVNRKGEYVVEGSKAERIAGVTSECAKVTTLAGFVDHAFYKHGNSREEIAAMVELCEQAQNRRVAVVGLEHYINNRFAKKIARQNTLAARQREQVRRNGRRVFATN